MEISVEFPGDVVHQAVLDTLVNAPWSDFITYDDPDKAFKVRAYRGVHAEIDEREAGGVGILHLDSDDPFAGDVSDGPSGVSGELRMELALRLVVSRELETNISGADVSGFRVLGAICVLAMRFLKEAVQTDGHPLWQVAQWVQDAGRGPDEESTSDEGQLVQNIVVIYRVLESDPTHLLRQGEDA